MINIPTDIKFYNNYINKLAEFDKKFKLALDKKLISATDYYLRRHFFALPDCD